MSMVKARPGTAARIAVSRRAAVSSSLAHRRTEMLGAVPVTTQDVTRGFFPRADAPRVFGSLLARPGQDGRTIGAEHRPVAGGQSNEVGSGERAGYRRLTLRTDRLRRPFHSGEAAAVGEAEAGVHRLTLRRRLEAHDRDRSQPRQDVLHESRRDTLPARLGVDQDHGHPGEPPPVHHGAPRERGRRG
jgi:hypothetical protein